MEEKSKDLEDRTFEITQKKKKNKELERVKKGCVINGNTSKDKY